MMQFCLFDNEIAFDTFTENSKNFEWYKKNGVSLRIDDEDRLETYYSRQYDFCSPPLYLMDTVNGSVEGKNDVRYMEIMLENDFVLIVFRIIQLMKTKRIHLFDLPISLNGNASSVVSVLNVLKESGLVTFIFKEKYKTWFDSSEPKESYNDYYYDLDYDVKNVFTGKWKGKTGINKFLNHLDGYEILDLQGKKEWEKALFKCRRLWWEGKNEKTRDNELKFLKNSLSLPADRIWNLALVHNGVVLGAKTLIIHSDYAVMPLQFSVARQYNDLNDIDNIVLRHIDKCLRYASCIRLLEHGVKREYILGFAPFNKSLKNHKELHSDGVIRYFQSR